MYDSHGRAGEIAQLMRASALTNAADHSTEALAERIKVFRRKSVGLGWRLDRAGCHKGVKVVRGGAACHCRRCCNVRR